MKPIDGDALVKLLRKHGMDDAAELAELMPRINIKREPVSDVIADFRASNELQIELDTSAYSDPIHCYYSYRAALTRRDITDCYVFKERGHVYLARVPGRGVDGKTAVRRT